MRWQWDDPIDVLRATLGAGGVVAVPTESTYGLAVDPRDPRGVEAIYEIKGRTGAKALPVVAADPGQLFDLGVPRQAPELAAVAPLWPAPLTAVLPLAAPLAATGGRPELAARVPAHPRLRQLLRLLGHALTATSANRSGRPPVLDPQELEPLLAGRTAAVVDGGVLPGGPPSTVVAWPRGKLRVVRSGAFPADRLPARIGPS